MENFIISLNAVGPMFLMIALGLICRKTGMIPGELAPRLNKLVFAVLTPVLLFYNIYRASQGDGHIRPALLFYIVAAVLLLFAAVFLLVRRLVPEKEKQGVMIQGIFRSNYVLLGLPIVLSLFSLEEAAVTSIAAAVIVPLFNVLAVFALETCRGSKVNWRRILPGVVKNPLIIGTALGLTLWVLGLRLPALAENTISSLAACATPMALLALGASFQLSDLWVNTKYLTWAVAGRLIIYPAIVLTLGAFLGFRGVELATLMAIFASPTAIASFAMALQMEGDGPLAAGIVVLTSVFSCITIFLWTFFLKQLGLI